MIGGPIGKAIGAAFPDNVATIFNRSVTANVDASVSITKSAGKAVMAAVDLAAALGNFAIIKRVSANVDVSVSVVKAISYTVAAALIGASGLVRKSVGKIVTAALISVLAIIRRAFLRSQIFATPLVGQAPDGVVIPGETAEATTHPEQTITAQSSGASRIKAI